MFLSFICFDEDDDEDVVDDDEDESVKGRIEVCGGDDCIDGR